MVSEIEGMSTEQNMTQAAIEAAKAPIMVVREVADPLSSARTIKAAQRMGFPIEKQPTFGWKSPNEYNELCDFKIEVKIIFLRNNYNIQESKNIAAWLSRYDHDSNRDKEISDTSIAIIVIVLHRYTRLRGSQRIKNSNLRWWTLGPTVRICILWLSINGSWGMERTATTLVIQGWECYHWWDHYEGKKKNSACIFAEQSTEPAILKLHGHREDKTAGMWIHLLNQYECHHGKKESKTAPNTFTFKPYVLRTKHATWDTRKAIGIC